MHRTWLGGGALAAVLAAWTPGALGQEALEQGAPGQETPAPRPRPAEPAPPGPAAETAADLDALVAPVALYPDALLTQVFVAATYPLDVAKADRFLDRTQGMPDKDRAQAAEAEPWDSSVQILAGGFPTVLRMMAADLDWTERLGDAVIAQTDGLLDAAQRMRAQAAAAGNLETNAAQVVEVDDGAIRVAPADPEKVYVPVYDPAQAFVPATAAAPAPVVVEDDDTTDWLTMGAISFGTALLVDEIFDDDDHWHGYWGHGPAYIDWDDADLYPRRDVDIDGDVNIDIDRIDADGGRIGDFDRDALRQDRREMRREQGGWEPSPDQRARAQENIARRQGARLENGGAAGRLEGLEEHDLGEGPLAERGLGEGGLGEGGLGAAAAGVAAGAAGGALAARSGGEARARLEAANARRAPERKFEGAASALQPGKATPPRAAKERDRGAASLDRPRAAAETHRPKAAPPKVVNKPAKAMKPARKPPAANPAFKKQAGGARTKAASHRGARSGGGRGGLRR